MYRRTFEVFAKWIAAQNNVSLAFDTSGGAHADMKNDVLHLPEDIASEHALGALALVMHEGAHIKHSKIIPIKKVAPAQSDFHILNAIEDIRIDRKTFNIMPNVFNFYEELVKKEMDLTKTKEMDFQVPEAARRLCASILVLEGFQPNMDKVDQQFLSSSPLLKTMEKGIKEIEAQDWSGVTKTIQDIKKILKIDPKQDKPNKATTMTGDPDGKDEGQGEGMAIKIDGSGGKDPAQASGKPDPNDLSGVGKIIRPASCWGKGKRMEGGSSLATSPLAMDEQCANQFKEILNIKEIKILEDGSTLDTDNLISLYTGDIGTLFKQERTVRNKKSKIMFLLDCSSSMGEYMLDNKRRRYEVVKSAVQKLIAILKEVQEIEGLNVDWEVSQFDTSYTLMPKDNWEHSYYPNGGTSFITGFNGAMDSMLKDYTVEGKRIIVAFSDGDISDNEIDHVEGLIKKHYADVRMLIVGVGSNMAGAFVKNIVHDNVIIAQDNATEVLMKCIEQML